VTRLVARTVALSELPDLLAEAGDDGRLWRAEGGNGLAAHGVARRLELPDGVADSAAVDAVSAALSAIEVEDEVGLPGCGAVAIGALPFDPHAAGTLVIPERVVGRAGDRGWVTTIAPVGSAPVPVAAAQRTGTAKAAAGGEPPDRFTLESTMPHAEWKSVIGEAVEALQAGQLDKVVLARRVDITANRDFVVSDVLERLTSLYPSCMVFSIEGFVGASPELLIRRTGDLLESHPLAGTVARSGDRVADAALVAALMASPKARHEHGLVIDAMRSALSGVCEELTVPEQPSVLGLRNVSHLATHIAGRLSAPSPPTALQLVSLVHPTPAVAGYPAPVAIEYLQKAEGFDRGCYAGPVGWVDGRGDGAWALGIRCAELSGSGARIYAGNGIVDGSDPAEELAETQLKLQALLAALVRP
jgi:menaquinone-specific isochorismate synthase